MGKRIAERRPLGARLRYAFEEYLDPKGTHTLNNERHIAADFKARLGVLETHEHPAVGPYISGDRFTRLVDDKLFDLLAGDARVTVGASTEAGARPFALLGRELVLHGNSHLMQTLQGSTDAVIDQVMERFALHLLQQNGAPAEAVYALHDWMVASEKLRDAATRRVNLNRTMAKAVDDRGEAASFHPRKVPEIDDEIEALREAIAEADDDVARLRADEKAAARRYESGDFEGLDDGSLRSLLARMDRAADQAEAFRTSIGRPVAARQPRAAATSAPAKTSGAKGQPKARPAALDDAEAFLAKLNADAT